MLEESIGLRRKFGSRERGGGEVGVTA